MAEKGSSNSEPVTTTSETNVEERPLTELEKNFEKAAERLPNIVSKLDSNQLLFCYARYKQATQGACNIPKPDTFEETQKWAAWKGLGDMSQETAMKEYIDAVKSNDPNWNEDKNITIRSKDVFDWVRTNNLDSLEQIIRTKDFPINQRDELKMTLLHWACDLGFASIAEVLLQNNIDINAQDDYGQTALHLASFCGYPDIVQLLLENGAKMITDDNGLTAKDVAFNEEIANLFPSCYN
ncbi:acyl-CoA-binding domain-containing protein 6-like [Centruroides sculpturatus]|uniref:acyl-CoA-binding domain-containing protein 6-like n=1 Tax=Centruroides sculpturatus TaxID=218467 RepID=UPI000C6E324A|nr:acyl-CoA-binding domain-containing protein 6-like [Centruroides sculpturatus]